MEVHQSPIFLLEQLIANLVINKRYYLREDFNIFNYIGRRLIIMEEIIKYLLMDCNQKFCN